MNQDDLTGLRVLTTKKLSKLLEVYEDSPRIKPVSTPNAQSTTMCDVPTRIQQITTSVDQARQAIKRESYEVYLIFILQFENALRISEVLNIKPTDIDLIGNVLIRSGKGSNPKIIPTGEARQYLLKCRKFSVQPFANYNRFFIYRLYKKYNLVYHVAGNKNNSVTHTARHMAAITARNNNFDEKAITLHLSHKSKNSTKHYGK